MIWSGCCQNPVPGQKDAGRSIVWTFPWNRHQTAILLLRLLSQHALWTTFSSLPWARKAANYDLHKNVQTVLCVCDGDFFSFFLFLIMHIFVALHQYCKNIL